MPQHEGALEALLQEDRTFKPSEEFTAQANIKDTSLYEMTERDRERFWAQMADRLDWFQKWDKVL